MYNIVYVKKYIYEYSFYVDGVFVSIFFSAAGPSHPAAPLF